MIRDASPWEQFKTSLSLVSLVLVAGTIGFLVLNPNRGLFQSFYLTVTIVTTVGLKDPDFNAHEEIWSLIVMLVGITVALYAAGNLVAFLIGGELKRVLGRRQLQDKINRLNHHYIVCGFGRMGRALCRSLASRDISFVLIDHDPAKVRMADELGFLYIRGDATSERNLELAQISKALGLASCLKSDADNVLVTLSARGLNSAVNITARAEQEETEHKLERAGANRVICPPKLGANRIMQMMLHPAVDDLMDVVVRGRDLEISKVRALDLPGAIGQTLSELKIPSLTGVSIVVVVEADGRKVFNPPPDFSVKRGDEMLVIGPPDGVEKLLNLLG
jgi:voltage-gated potassium channel